MNNITNNIIDKIKAGEIKMQPRWHFVLRGALMLLSVLLVAFIAVYLLSFVVFTLQKSGLYFAPAMGLQGIVLFVVNSPWLLISLLGLFLLILYILVSHYSFSYRKPLVYSMIGVVLVVIALASVIQYGGLHQRVGDFAERNNVPGLAPFYRDAADRRPDGVTAGVVAEMTASGFVLETKQGVMLQVAVTPQTKTPRQTDISEGDEVVVFGDRSSTTIQAFGVRPDDGRTPPAGGRDSGRPTR